jgi:hypothetical protein
VAARPWDKSGFFVFAIQAWWQLTLLLIVVIVLFLLVVQPIHVVLFFDDHHVFDDSELDVSIISLIGLVWIFQVADPKFPINGAVIFVKQYRSKQK